MKTIGVEERQKIKATMYPSIKDIATKMERRNTILGARSTIRREENRREAEQKEKAATNIYHTKLWHLLAKILQYYEFV